MEDDEIRLQRISAEILDERVERYLEMTGTRLLRSNREEIYLTILSDPQEVAEIAARARNQMAMRSPLLTGEAKRLDYGSKESLAKGAPLKKLRRMSMTEDEASRLGSIDYSCSMEEGESEDGRREEERKKILGPKSWVEEEEWIEEEEDDPEEGCSHWFARRMEGEEEEPDLIMESDGMKRKKTIEEAGERDFGQLEGNSKQKTLSGRGRGRRTRGRGSNTFYPPGGVYTGPYPWNPPAPNDGQMPSTSGTANVDHNRIQNRMRGLINASMCPLLETERILRDIFPMIGLAPELATLFYQNTDKGILAVDLALFFIKIKKANFVIYSVQFGPGHGEGECLVIHSGNPTFGIVSSGGDRFGLVSENPRTMLAKMSEVTVSPMMSNNTLLQHLIRHSDRMATFVIGRVVQFEDRTQTIEPSTLYEAIRRSAVLWIGDLVPPSTTYPITMNQEVVVADLDVLRQGDHFVLTFTTNLSERVGIFNPGENKLRLTQDELKTIVHDSICSVLFTGKSDSQLGGLVMLGDASDHQTPDFICTFDINKHLVCEVKTTTNNRGAQDKYLEAITKYRDAVRRRVPPRGRMILTGLAISPSECVTNLPISNVDIINLGIALSIGRNIQSQISILNLIEEENLDEEERAERIKEALSSPVFDLEFEADDPLHIDLRRIGEWRGPIALDEVHHALSVYWQDSMADLFECSYPESYKKVMIMVSDNEGRRVDLKAPVQLPLILPDEGTLEIGDIPDIEADCPLTRLWAKARMSYFQNINNFYEPPLFTEDDVSDRIQNNMESDKATKRKCRRVHFTLDDPIYFYVQGIDAKRHKNYSEVKSKQEESKMPFSWSVSVNDIDKFLNDESWFEENDYSNPYLSRGGDLLEKAAELTGDPMTQQNLELYMTLMNKKIFVALAIVDEIVQELNLSRKQSCSHKEFIMKKLSQHDVWLLIHPVKGDNHIFFSVLTKYDGKHCHLPFKVPLIKDGYAVYDFVQMDADRIDQLAYLPLKMVGFFARQCLLLKRNVFSEAKKTSIRVVRHFLAQLLFFMEDKRQTSSAIQQFRYSYMECLIGIDTMDPLKIVTKIDSRPKSRLMVWAVMNMIKVAITMKSHPASIGNKEVTSKSEDESEDVARRLLSWVDLEEIPSYEAAIELSYYCNLHNKARKNKTHDSFEIVKKILEEEEKLYTETNLNFCGRMNVYRPKVHEFYPHFVSYCARAGLDSMRGGSNPEDFKKVLTKEIYKKLSKVKLSELATTRSSAIGLSKDKKFEMEPINSRKAESIKCLEACINHSSEIGNMYIFTKFDFIMQKVLDQGGILSNLFPKEQIGGAREIFRLELYSRICLKFVETIAYVIDERMPNAMLTKGDKKVSRSYDHYSNLKGNLSRGVTAINSTDCKRWAQNFVMPAFGCTFSNLLEDELLIPFCKVLNSITDKGIELPYELCRMFTIHSQVDSFDPGLNQLKKEFLEDGGPRYHLRNKGDRTMMNRSNMMQGQTHFVSDIHHACYLQGAQKFAESMIHTAGKKLKMDLKSRITTKASSDDSSVIVTVYANESNIERRNKICLLMALTACKFFVVIYPLGCMRVSLEKSTIGNLNLIEEFNSLWLLRNTILSAPIKNIYTAVTTPCTSNLEMRTYQTQGLLMSLFESGSSTLLCSLVQMSQCLAHYSLLGLLVNRNFHVWKKTILDKLHPMFGFFPLQPASVCGMLPMEFTKYVLCQQSLISTQCEWYLYCTDGVEYHSEFGRMCSIKLSQGQEKKLIAMKERLEVNEEALNNYIMENIGIIFKYIDDLEGMRFMLKVKLMSAGFSDSLVAQKLHKILTSSAYIFSEPCITMTVGKGDKRVSSKINLYTVAKRTTFPDLEDPEGKLNLLFSHRPLFDRVINYCETSKRVLTSVRTKKRLVKIQIVPVEPVTTISLQDCLEFKWTGYPKHSKTYLRSSLEHYESIYPWIRESLKASLESEECPFQTPMSLMNFVKTREKTVVKVRSYSSARIGMSTMETLQNIASYSYAPGYRLEVVDDGIEEEVTDNSLPLIRSQLTLIFDGPQKNDEKLFSIYDRLNSIDHEEIFRSQCGEEGEKLALLCFASQNHKHRKSGRRTEIEIKEAMAAINRRLIGCNFAIVGSWSRPNRRKMPDGTYEYHGYGSWVGYMEDRKVWLEVYGDVVDQISFCETVRCNAYQLGRSISKLVDHLGLKCNPRPKDTLHFFRKGHIITQRLHNSIPIFFMDTIACWDPAPVRIEVDLETKRISMMQEDRAVFHMKFNYYSDPHILVKPKLWMENESTGTVLAWMLDPWFTGQGIKFRDLKTRMWFLTRTSHYRDWLLQGLLEQVTMRHVTRSRSASTASSIPSDSIYDHIFAGLREVTIDDDDVNQLAIENDVSRIPNSWFECLNECADFVELLSEQERIELKVPQGESADRRVVKSMHKAFPNLLREMQDDFSAQIIHRCMTQGYFSNDPPILVSISRALNLPQLAEMEQEEEPLGDL